MAYVQEVDVKELPLMRKSFIEVATAEILDPTREGEPEKFKKNYPHYNFNDDTSIVGSTRYDSSFKNHGADEIDESDNGLTKVCMPCRPKTVIAVPKQVVEECCCCCECPPEKVVIPPRPYEPVKVVKEVPYCMPIPSIVDNIPHIKEERETFLKEIGNECVACQLTDDALEQAIKDGLDPYDGVVITGETKVIKETPTGSVQSSQSSDTAQPTVSGSEDTQNTKPKKKKEDKGKEPEAGTELGKEPNGILL